MDEMTKKICADAFGALLAVMVLPGGIARANDGDFTNYLASHGISLGSPAAEVNMARTMCQDLDSGYSQKDEVDTTDGVTQTDRAAGRDVHRRGHRGILPRQTQPQQALLAGQTGADRPPV